MRNIFQVSHILQVIEITHIKKCIQEQVDENKTAWNVTTVQYKVMYLL